MQFHHHGYVSGEPRIEPAAGTGLNRPEALPEHVDVLVVGAGPAGVMTAAQLSQFPNLTTRLVERRPHRLEVGQADGIQARSVETFQAFGFANRIIDEAYRITTTSFWKPNPENPEHIIRTTRTDDDPTGISEFPHLIVNQARVQDYFVEFMANSPTRMQPDYGYDFVGLTVTQGEEYPVTVTLAGADGERTVKAKYVVGCDGARSKVREAIGRTLSGDQAFHAWGVMDVLADTDFPDIRTKCAIQSHDGGSILLIPREGGHLFRMYVDLGEVAADDNGAVRKTTIEQIIAQANEIINPYTLTVKNVAWHSVYEVGHRLTDKFDDVPTELVGTQTPRVFITGDACHTHSAKAGQGMNVSMQDGFNLGWKLGHVLDGRAPESLLDTYSAERQVVAKNLIDFDKQWSTLMAAKPTELRDPHELEDFYVRTAEFPSGFMTEYLPSQIISGAAQPDLATGFPLGRRFKSAPVVRVCDANPLELGHQARADGRWRLYIFADAAAAGPASPTTELAEWLRSNPESPLVAGLPTGVRANDWFEVNVVYQQPYTHVDLGQVPSAFLPRVGELDLVDRDRVYAIDPEHDIFNLRGVSRSGAIVVVRPDQYVANILPLNATQELGEFFAGLRK